MARLVSSCRTQGKTVTLSEAHTFGRVEDCQTVIARPSVSGYHAVIAWRGDRWTLRDLGSRNGTYLNGSSVSSATETRVNEGDEIHFAETDEHWVVLDAAAPGPRIVQLDGLETRTLVDLGGVYPLTQDGALGRMLFQLGEDWWEESREGERRIIRDGEVLELDRRRFRLVLPKVTNSTSEASAAPIESVLVNAYLDIVVSFDEERAAVSVVVGTRTVRLEPRTHLYLLAHLARKRVADLEGEGWVDTASVCSDLALTCEGQLAVHVHRCRIELRSIVQDASGIIDRGRRGLLRLGLPPERVSVHYG